MKRIGTCFFIAALAAAGCGKKVAEIAAEKAIEYSAKADGQDVKVNIQSGDETMVVESKDGSFATGENVAIPENFPKDVPVYKGLKPTMSSTMGGEGSFMLSGTIEDSPDDAATYYSREAAANGWTETTKISQPQMIMLAYEKDDRAMTIMSSSEAGSTSLSITVAKK